MKQSVFVFLLISGLCILYSCLGHQYHYVNEQKSWIDARRYCREKHTDLATIDDEEDMRTMLKITTSDDAWIGLHNVWQWSQADRGFLSEEESLYRNWETGEPNNYGGNENCAEMREGGGFNDDRCDKQRSFICYDESSTERYILIKEEKNWTEAQSYCRQHHTDLMSHTATSAFCRSIKLQCELYPSREVAICLDPYCGLGFVLWCLCSVYSGHQSILIPPSELEVNPALWLLAVSQYKVRDTFCSYSVMELCTKGLGLQTDSLKSRGLELSRVRTCVVVAEERPRIALTQSFSKLFKDLGLHPRAVSTSFGCRVNLAICLQPHRLGKLADQGTSGPDPTTVFVDMRALRHDRVRLVERGSPHSLPVMESGKILPGVRIIIANPETKGPLGDSHLGEIWVHSGHNASGYFTVYGDESLQSDHFNSRLSFGDTQTLWARTGYLGFLRRTELTDASGERHDALYVVGALDEAMELRGMRYHPIDIETSVIRTHKSITECAVFTWTNLLVVVVELDGFRTRSPGPGSLVTNVVLEEHYLIVGVVVVVDIGVIPINSRGEKQRMHLRDGFLADQLDPIYVAYNM
ncbi:hypothetical protein SKAU_G00378200 [Synaphobranchus kaupii]|uniref:C-type lectin domain-containing protein n=1 Tax=Synaphobranchus kaupii TaxID=118154 RepID=A0A9Q1IDJ8_SYNKA|nr:hypothetical protein SKAU_G00378200 [Synaphobranchus kaupii]